MIGKDKIDWILGGPKDYDDTGTSEFPPIARYLITFNGITMPVIGGKITYYSQDLKEVLSENSIKGQA